MNFRSFVPPVALAAWAAVQRSLSESAVRFMRGDDVVDAPRTRFAQPYAQSAWIRDAVAKVAGPISGRALKFYTGGSEFADARLAEWWASPAQGPRLVGGRTTRLSLDQVLFDLAAWERLEGETFLLLDDVWLFGAGPRMAESLPPFVIANPRRMQAVLMAGELAGWRYTDAGGRQLTLVPEQVIHRPSFNPYDDFRGVGCMQAASIAAEGAFLTGVYIRDLARNNGDQGMVVVAKTGVVTDPQRQQILADLKAKRAALARGQARDLLLAGDIAVDRPEEQAASAELVGSKQMSHEEIFVAFGVPPSMAAVKQSYSIGKESDKYQLITDTCQPVGVGIASSLAQVAARQAGRPLTAELDWDDHPVMIEVRNSRIESGLKLWGVGMPMKNANDYLGLGMKPFPGWDVGYLPFSVAPVAGDQPADPVSDPALQETPPAEEDPAVAQLRLLILARSRQRACKDVTPTKAAGDWLASFQCLCADHAGVVASKGRDARELAQWRDLMSQRRTTVASFKGAFTRTLMGARADVLRRIESAAGQLALSPAATRKAAAADFLFDLARFAEGFLGTMRDRHKTALETAGQQLFTEVGKDDPFKYPQAEVLDYLSGRENKLKDTPREIHEEIKATLEEGLVAGDTTQQLAARVRSAFNGISSERALRIAMTETAAAYGAGRDEAMVQAGVQWKKWLTSGGDNVRAAHAAANGQTVRSSDAFEVDGEQLMYPGDDAGSPGNVINCHCVSVATSEGPKDS